VTDAGYIDLERAAMREASEWLARLRAEDCSAKDRQGFSDWLAKSERNGPAFERATSLFDNVGAIEDRWPRDYGATADEDEAREQPARSRRAFLIGAGVAATAAGGIGWQAALAGGIETGFGERRTLNLKDGSVVQLDSETAIREPWLETRALDLQRGRISLKTSKAESEFRINAGRYLVRGEAMDADLSLQAGDLIVSILQGSALIERDGAKAVRLGTGQRLLPTGLVDEPPMAMLTAWRQGRLIFSDTSLADACGELNRYDRVRLAPAPSIAGLRISGTFRMGDNAGFAAAVTHLLPIDRNVGRDVIQLNARSKG